MNLPELLVVTDYHSLTAYLILPDGVPQILKQIDFEHDSQTSVPLIDWTEGKTCYHAVAETIAALLDRYHPAAWGLACPPALGGELTAELPDVYRDSLAIMLERDVGGVDIANVAEVFASSAEGRHSA